MGPSLASSDQQLLIPLKSGFRADGARRAGVRRLCCLTPNRDAADPDRGANRHQVVEGNTSLIAQARCCPVRG